jgi:hypothetical protein
MMLWPRLRVNEGHIKNQTQTLPKRCPSATLRRFVRYITKQHKAVSSLCLCNEEKVVNCPVVRKQDSRDKITLHFYLDTAILASSVLGEGDQEWTGRVDAEGM